MFFIIVMKPGLYIVSTPIGNLKDITLRALETLKECELILCEDTRVTQKLLEHYGISKPVQSYHTHNEHQKLEGILGQLQHKKIALVSDAGTPLISDPGFPLVKACREQKIFVTVIPGASSVIGALTLSRLPPYPFLFAGFAKSSDFQKWFSLQATLVFFESTHRLVKTIKSMQKSFPNREITVVRELTKLYEEAISGSYDDVLSHYNLRPPKGEAVVLLSPPHNQEGNIDWKEAADIIKAFRPSQAAKEIAKRMGVSREKAYEIVTGKWWAPEDSNL